MHCCSAFCLHHSLLTPTSILRLCCLPVLRFNCTELCPRRQCTLSFTRGGQKCEAFLYDADKGKKSRFRQLTDLVKTGMSAATSRANSRTPSRGPTQDLEQSEPISRQGSQRLPGIPIPSKGTQDMGSKRALKSALQGRTSSGPVAEGHTGLLDRFAVYNFTTTNMLPHERPRSSPQSINAESLLAMSDDCCDTPRSDDAVSIFQDIIAAQPSRSASSTALRSHWPVDHNDSTPDLIFANPMSAATQPRQTDSNIGMPVAEGIEGKSASTATARTRSIPKNAPGFMSSASTGRGVTAHTPAIAAAPAADTQTDPLTSPRQGGQQGLMPGALPDELAGALSPMERFMRMEDDQVHAAQMHSMAADEMESLIPTIRDAADIKDGEPHLGQLSFLGLTGLYASVWMCF